MGRGRDEIYLHPFVHCPGNAIQQSKGMPLVIGVFQPADD